MTRVYLMRINEGENSSEKAWSLLDTALIKETGKDLSAYTVKREEKGKPYFEEGYPHFSLSHSGLYVCCAISDFPVGVDIQTIRKISPAVMRRYLDSDETDPLLQTGMWARFESLGKCLGCGIPHKNNGDDHFFTEKTYPDICLAVCCSKKDSDTVIFEL